MEVVCKRKPQVEEGGGGRSGIWILEFCASQKKFSTSKDRAQFTPGSARSLRTACRSAKDGFQ